MRTKMPNDIKALRAFVRAMEQCDPDARRAAILYLVDRYLKWDPPPSLTGAGGGRPFVFVK